MLTRKAGRCLAAAFALVALCSASSLGDDIRDELQLASDRAFARLLESAEKRDFDTVAKGMALLSPLDERVRSQLSVSSGDAVSQAISTGDTDAVLRAIQRFIVNSSRVLLADCAALGTDRDAIKRKLRFLLKDYVVLEPYAQKVDVASANRARQLIQRMTVAAGSDAAVFQGMADELEAVLESTFPATGS